MRRLTDTLGGWLGSLFFLIRNMLFWGEELTHKCFFWEELNNTHPELLHYQTGGWAWSNWHVALTTKLILNPPRNSCIRFDQQLIPSWKIHDLITPSLNLHINQPFRAPSLSSRTLDLGVSMSFWDPRHKDLFHPFESCDTSNSNRRLCPLDR